MVRGPVIGSPLALAATMLTAFIALLPAGVSGAGAGFDPHLALAPLFMASIGERIRIGPVGAFATGLIVDVLTLAPLGVCAASYLAFHGVVARERDVLAEVPLLVRWLFFVPLAGAVAAVHIAAMLLVTGVEELRPGLAISLIATAVGYPVLSCLAGLFKRRPAGARRPLRG